MAHTTTIFDIRPPVPEIVVERSMSGFERLSAMNSHALGTGNTLDITDVMSFACWCKYVQPSHTSQDIVFCYRPVAGGFANNFQIGTNFNGLLAASSDVQIQMRNDSSTIIQDHTWADVLDGGTNTWKHFVFTWDGTSDTNSAKLYVDGFDAVASKTTTVNLDGSGIVDVVRNIMIGDNFTGLRWQGSVYNAALYNTVISAEEAALMWNKGNAKDFDLETNFGAYQSADSMVHYYRPGLDRGDEFFGTDYGVGTNQIDIENAQLDYGFVTEDIPQAVGDYQGYVSSNLHAMQKDLSALSISDEHTMVVWMRRTGAQYSRAIIHSAEDDGVSNMRELYHNDSNMLTYELRNSAGSASAGDVLEYQIEDLPNSSSGPEPAWEQFVFVYDGTNASDNTLRIYRNAIELTTGAGSGIGDPYLIEVNTGNPNQTDTAVNFGVGGPHDGTFGQMWDGNFYYVAIWDSVLTASEITALYANGSPALLDITANFGNYSSSGNLQHYWNFKKEGFDADRGLDLGLSPLNIGDDAVSSGNAWQAQYWELAEYPGSLGDAQEV